ncbi:transforming growth factor beta regulator 1 [Drosophila subobscura]|uniref:transforming growth factor beta regulator 1 n=1 Tax=Drosophila subobscura TaxID=7241 RepID=UPI00155A52D0|nr:transforming growth factor beta regulator 1 [Drosophila subobscura]
MHFNYKRKYDRLKRCIKLYILENSCLTDEICHLQSELAATRSQRIYLIKRLMFHEGLEKANIVRNCVLNGKPESNENFIRTLNKKKQSIVYPSEIEEDSQNGSTSKNKKSFPLHLNNLLLHSLGDISGSSNFHNESWIYPVGYVATRIYAHPKDPLKKCVFTCKILNNAGVPQFQIIPDNDLDGVFFGETPNMCHAELLNTIQRYANTKIPFTAQGESFFGLSNPKIQSLLRLDPGFQRCFNFKGYNVQNQKSLNNPGLSFETLQTFLT